MVGIGPWAGRSDGSGDTPESCSDGSQNCQNGLCFARERASKGGEEEREGW